MGQKQELVKAMTKTMVDIAALSADSLHIISHDLPKPNWGRKASSARTFPPRSTDHFTRYPYDGA
jgi:phenylpyruvate tautomerase PptA (4-oxalocrotonate tautomerase family)